MKVEIFNKKKKKKNQRVENRKLFNQRRVKVGDPQAFPHVGEELVKRTHFKMRGRPLQP